jgi:putative ABC transport system permease protein
VVLRALPYADPDRIVHVSERGSTGEAINFSWPDWLDFRARARTVTSMALFKTDTFVLARGAEEPRQITAGMVTGDLFAALGAQPAIGRGFTAAEDAPGGPPAVILSWRIWSQAFGGDRDLVAAPSPSTRAPTPSSASRRRTWTSRPASRPGSRSGARRRASRASAPATRRGA